MSPRSGSITTSPAEFEQISFKLNKIFIITEETDTNKKEGATPDPSIKRGNMNRG